MKHIKRFNEELNPETYLSASQKLKYRHPSRAKKLDDYGRSKLPKIDKDKVWEFEVSGDYNGTCKASVLDSLFISYDGSYSSSVFKSLDVNVVDRNGKIPGKYPKNTILSRGKSEPIEKYNLGAIRAGENGLVWGGDNISGNCFVKDRKEANELHKFLLDYLNINVPVNTLYKEHLG